MFANNLRRYIGRCAALIGQTVTVTFGSKSEVNEFQVSGLVVGAGHQKVLGLEVSVVVILNYNCYLILIAIVKYGYLMAVQKSIMNNRM